jgi:2-polyprenyl-3-methyl-5-hydroxy-6-metoxy-1,4-benzoquinol methylase
MSHAMMAEATHDERAEQLFTRDLKSYIYAALDPPEKILADAVAGGLDADSDVETVRDALFEHESFRSWISMKRTAQEMMWNVVGESIDRQIDVLKERAHIAKLIGSLTLDDDFTPPAYLTAQDTHLMPGGYAGDEGDIRQGAMMDRGGAVYMLGRNGPNGGMLNDGRGQGVVSHLFDVYPDLEPRRILELGCGVGVSATAMASHFPDAEIHGIDVGASMLRYAHARAEHLGAAIHFAQQNAERTQFEDESFDLVFSAAVFHESSYSAIRNIIRESRRLLRPGGVMIHSEVPLRYSDMDLWGKLSGEFETHYNNEPCWREALSCDYVEICREAGFADPKVGFQPIAHKAVRGQHAFATSKPAGFGQWFMVSARK